MPRFLQVTAGRSTQNKQAEERQGSEQNNARAKPVIPCKQEKLYCVLSSLAPMRAGEYWRNCKAVRSQALQEQLKRDMLFTNDKNKLSDPKKQNDGIATAKTVGGTTYFNADLLNRKNIGKQLQIASTLAYEAYRDGNPKSSQQGQELQDAARAGGRYQILLKNSRHGESYVNGLSTVEQGDLMIKDLYQKGIITEEQMDQYIAHNYRNDGDYYSVLFGAGAIGGGGVGGTAEAGLVVSYDPETKIYQVGSYETFGGGAYIGLGGSAQGVFTNLPNADKLSDVSGLSFILGGGFGEGFVGGGELSMSLSNPKNWGWGLSGGGGGGPVFFDIHLFVTRTFTQLQAADKDLGRALSNAFINDPALEKFYYDNKEQIQKAFSQSNFIEPEEDTNNGSSYSNLEYYRKQNDKNNVHNYYNWE